MHDNHWIVASTIACHPGEVNIYDSLYDDQPEDVLRTICGCLVMHEPPAIVNLMKVAKQSGTNDWTFCSCSPNSNCQWN